jgi:hexosaminidase
MGFKAKIYFLFVVFLISSKGIRGADQLPLPFRVIPEPSSIELEQGEGIDYSELKTILIGESTSRPVLPPILSYLPETEQNTQGVLVLKIVSSGDIPDSPQGYVMKIGNRQVEIISKGDAGIFYGCQTLEQLLEDSRDTGAKIPACKIIDFPKQSYRAVHWDVKHHLDKMFYYYESIDRLARYKINGIIFELEDKLRYRRQPLIAAPQAISIDELAALTEYARDRFIEITPLIQGLGHATFILKHDKYKHLRELEDNRWAFCPMDEGTYEVLFDMYRDAIEATPDSRYLHVGGDEVGNIGLCHRCKDYAEKNGNLALNLYWLSRVCKFLEEQGRIPIFWDDMPFKYANLWRSVAGGQRQSEEETEKLWNEGEPILNKMLDKFPKNAVYMHWIYEKTRYPSNIRALKWFRDSGLKTMIANSTQTTTELMPEYVRVEFIKEFIELAAEYNIDGMLCTAWDDSSPLMEMYWRGFIAAAEYSWSPLKPTLEEYEKAFYQREFGIETVEFSDLYYDLYEGVKFWQRAPFPRGTRRSRQNVLQDFSGLEHWISPEDQRKREEVNYEEKLIALPDINNPGQWSTTYQNHLQQAQQEIERYKKNSLKIDQLLRISRRNRYYWQVMKAMNDFQITTAKLLITLQNCDTPNKSQFNEAIKNINLIQREYQTSWNHLENIYGKIRFVAYPSNYIKDRYFHFASQKEDLSFMIQAEELLYKKINKWLENMNR